MKKIRHIISSIIIAAVAFSSCNKAEEVQVPSFTVKVNQTAKVGEEIEFVLESLPNFLTFYSGEFGSEYEHRERTNIEGTVKMSFDCAQNWQNGTSLTDPGLAVLYSKDYDGSGTKESLSAATWIDVSERFTLPVNRTYEWTNSGVTDITDLASGNEPVYIAFKILADGKISEGNRQGEYRFKNFNIELAVEGKTTTLAVTDFNSTNWQTVNVQGENADTNKDQWVFWSNDFFRMNGTSADYTNEDWLITNKIDLTAVLPDKGRVIKSYADQIDSFTHTYTEAGIYTVTLAGSNTTIYGSEEQIEEFIIEVTE